jgi:regulator of replication initiation timing|tara:strand:+ start:232 stop:522 length:291 start_codon:yes stop_codon:yes gene_type:complete
MTDSSLNIYVLESIELELESIKELWGDAINENDKLTNEIGKLKRRIAELENAQLKSPHTQSMTAAPVAMFTFTSSQPESKKRRCVAQATRVSDEEE